MRQDFHYTIYSQSSCPRGRIVLLFEEIMPLLETPANYYPNFYGWYKKVCREVLLGRREIITVEHNNIIRGLTIIKRFNSENKICTLLVDKNFRKNHIAQSLMIEALSCFEASSQISLTIPDSHIDCFASLMSRFGFVRTKRVLDYYRPKKYEYFFSRFKVAHMCSHLESLSKRQPMQNSCEITLPMNSHQFESPHFFEKNGEIRIQSNRLKVMPSTNPSFLLSLE